MKFDNRSFLISWPVCISVLALLLNDHFLKLLFPGWITGKLSDFSGVFLVAYIIIGISKGRALISCFCVGFLFVFWKSPYSQFIIDAFNSYSPINIGRVLDYSDLLSLSMLPLAVYVYQNRAAFALEAKLSQIVKIPLIILTSLAIAGTSVIMPHHQYSIRKSEPTQEVDVIKAIFLIGEVASNNGLECISCHPNSRKGHYQNEEIELHYSILPDGRGVEFEITGEPGNLFFGRGAWDSMERIKGQLTSKLGSEFGGMELVIKLNDRQCSTNDC
jgi:hypothetical protein